MGVRLKKLDLMDEAAIEILDKDELVALAKIWRQRLFDYQGILFRVKRRFFSPKSERSGGGDAAGAPPSAPSRARGKTTKLPSERYPDALVREDRIDFVGAQVCAVCGGTMANSGMTEDSEYLDVGEKEYIVVEQRRHKHRCSRCHASIVTAPAPPRVTPGGSYSDGLIVDAALSKYCDLIPMERYCEMAGRGGFPGLPPHSLIQASHRLAEFFQGTYDLIKQETLSTAVLLADETPHRMLEGDAKTRWYLWGFSSVSACFFECHDTRSGDVSSEVLKLSTCQVLVSDAYSGYKKSVRVANKFRAEQGLALIQTAYCNAHARRQFSPGDDDAPDDAKFMVDQYEEIYRLNGEAKALGEAEVPAKRAAMKPYFEAMKDEALQKIGTYSSQSAMGGAYAYFLNYYEGLTLCLSNPAVPLDNNGSERLLRSHVVGRKTWYGTHSRRGAATAAVHFTVVESCKLNGVNPRAYYLDTVNRIHLKRELLTPRQYKARPTDNTE